LLYLEREKNIMNLLPAQAVQLAALFFFLQTTIALAQDETKEPPQTFVVKLGDQSANVLEGETAKLKGSFTDPQLTITPDPYRVFPYQGVRFQYPRTYSFEADVADADEKSWTLSGNDVSIMLFVLNARITAAGFADSMIGQFGRPNCKIVDANAKLKLGATEVSGTKIHVTIATHSITQEIYVLPAPRGKTRLLVLQDNPDEKGNHSAEAKGVLETLKKSFQVDGK
jgi:hypothetical protein